MPGSRVVMVMVMMVVEVVVVVMMMRRRMVDDGSGGWSVSTSYLDGLGDGADLVDLEQQCVGSAV